MQFHRMILGLALGAVTPFGQLDHRERGGIAQPNAELRNARVSTRPFAKPRKSST